VVGELREHSRLEAERGLGLGCEEQQRVGCFAQLIDKVPAFRTASEVGQRLATLGAHEYSEGQLGCYLAHRGAVVDHGASSAPDRSARSFNIAIRIRVLAVPRGTPSVSLISLAV
jgi:hypothetical protein